MKNALILLGILDDGDVQWLASQGRREHHANDSALIHEQRPLDTLYLLLEGEVRLVRANAGEIGRAGAGEILGEVSFVDSALPSASALCCGPVVTLTVPRTAVRDRLATDNGFAARFYRALAMSLAFRLRATQTLLGALRNGQTGGAVTMAQLPIDLMETAALAARRLHLLQEAGA